MGKWICNYHNLSQSGYPIFCLPYAGAGASIYRNWQAVVGRNISICPIQLPGREERIVEPMPGNIHELVAMIYDGIKDQLKESYSLFGHSMGGILAFELILKLQDEGKLLPDILFMSGSSIERNREGVRVGEMDNAELTRYLWDNGGTDRELLQCKEFRDCYYPIIRGDYRMLESYQPSGRKINCPIWAFAGSLDREVPIYLIENMSKYTDDFNIQFVTGDHFFIRSAATEIGKSIRQVACDLLLISE